MERWLLGRRFIQVPDCVMRTLLDWRDGGGYMSKGVPGECWFCPGEPSWVAPGADWWWSYDGMPAKGGWGGDAEGTTPYWEESDWFLISPGLDRMVDLPFTLDERGVGFWVRELEVVE